MVNRMRRFISNHCLISAMTQRSSGICSMPFMAWNKLRKHGMTHCEKCLNPLDSCTVKLTTAFFHKDEDGNLLVIAVYVDDKLIFSKNLDAIKCLKSQLSDHFKIMDLGKARWILGMEVIHDHQQGTISLSQSHYVETILDCFGLKDGWSVSTPLETNTKLVKIDVPEVDAKTYQSALGGLMYAMLVTCPDLAYAVGALSKHIACPGQAHFAALKWVYHYLCGTMDVCLVYRKTSELSLLGYVDADCVQIIHKGAHLCPMSETEEKRLWARKFQLYKQSKQRKTV